MPYCYQLARTVEGLSLLAFPVAPTGLVAPPCLYMPSFPFPLRIGRAPDLIGRLSILALEPPVGLDCGRDHVIESHRCSVESGNDATRAVTMIEIKPGRRCGFYAEELEDLAESIREQVIDCATEIEWYRDDSGVKYQSGAAEIQAIAANVPWEALTGAAATVFLEAVRDWMSRRYQARKSKYDTDVADALKKPLKRGGRHPSFDFSSGGSQAGCASLSRHPLSLTRSISMAQRGATRGRVPRRSPQSASNLDRRSGNRTCSGSGTGGALVLIRPTIAWGFIPFRVQQLPVPIDLDRSRLGPIGQALLEPAIRLLLVQLALASR